VNKVIKPLADEMRRLAKEAGFTVRGSLLVKEDSLIKTMQLDVLQNASSPAGTRFDLLFDVGISGISTFTARSRKWVLRCYGSKIPGPADAASEDFVLTGESTDAQVRQVAVARVSQAYKEFLMRFEDGHSLYRFVRDNALRFLAEGMALNDDYSRLRIYPWSALSRLELAGVYAAFLRLEEDADSIQEAAERFATGKNKDLDYLLPELRANIAEARSRAS
jgi:hypothetical protein